MKRRLITFWRVVHTGITNFLRNVTLAVAAISVMFVTLTIVLFSLIANATFENTIAQITDKISISIFLKDTTTEAQAKTLVVKLQHNPLIAHADYQTKEQALKRYIAQQAKINPNLQTAAAVSGNTIPATIHITPHNLNDIKSITKSITTPELAALQTADSPSYNGDRRQAIDNITHATKVLRKIGIVTVITFTVICALIIFNTIQMAIFNRRSELQIMRLLGASTWYIRGPFVVEAAIYGFLAAVFSVLVIGAAFLPSSNALQVTSLGLLDISFASQWFGDHFLQLLGIQIAIGMTLGILSAVIATRRYLKFKVK